MHLMIDIETAASAPDCIIRSIGAAFFCPITAKRDGEFYVNVEWNSCLAAGLKEDIATMQWWEKQSDEAKYSLWLPSPVPLRSALKQFLKFCQSMPITEVWANSPSFDIAILNWACKVCELSLPWDWWQQSDCRTLVKSNAKTRALKKAMDKTRSKAHNALGDVRYQIEYVVACKLILM